jgi:hypothetical protein
MCVCCEWGGRRREEGGTSGGRASYTRDVGREWGASGCREWERERFPRWHWAFGRSASQWGEREEGTSQPASQWDDEPARHVRDVGRLRSRGAPNRSLAGQTEVEGAHAPGKGGERGRSEGVTDEISVNPSLNRAPESVSRRRDNCESSVTRAPGIVNPVTDSRRRSSNRRAVHASSTKTIVLVPVRVDITGGLWDRRGVAGYT